MKKVITILRKAHEYITLTIAVILCAFLNMLGVDIDPDKYEDEI